MSLDGRNLATLLSAEHLPQVSTALAHVPPVLSNDSLPDHLVPFSRAEMQLLLHDTTHA